MFCDLSRFITTGPIGEDILSPEMARIYIEKNKDDETSMFYIDSAEACDQLLKELNQKGIREHFLHQSIKTVRYWLDMAWNDMKEKGISAENNFDVIDGDVIWKWISKLQTRADKMLGVNSADLIHDLGMLKSLIFKAMITIVIVVVLSLGVGGKEDWRAQFFRLHTCLKLFFVLF